MYGAFWCENCNKQKEKLGKEAMEMTNTWSAFRMGYTKMPRMSGRDQLGRVCGPYSEAWPMWVLPSPSTPETPEIGVQGKVLKSKGIEEIGARGCW